MCPIDSAFTNKQHHHWIDLSRCRCVKVHKYSRGSKRPTMSTTEMAKSSDLHFFRLTGWMYKYFFFLFHCLCTSMKPCVTYYWNMHLYLKSVPDCSMWLLSMYAVYFLFKSKLMIRYRAAPHLGAVTMAARVQLHCRTMSDIFIVVRFSSFKLGFKTHLWSNDTDRNPDRVGRLNQCQWKSLYISRYDQCPGESVRLLKL